MDDVGLEETDDRPYCAGQLHSCRELSFYLSTVVILAST
jgi:hypothetical protein